MNIYQRMSAITAELAPVAKNLNVETGKGKSYKAVSERDIIDAVKPIEIKHGVYSYPVSRRKLESQMLESTNQYGTKTTFYTEIETVYRFVNMDKPEEYIDITSFSTGLDSGDKGDGKAMTYGDKYALMKAYKISTGDDPDAKASEEIRYTKSGAPKTPEMASKNEKETLLSLCKTMGLDYRNILGKVGWSEGDKLTKDQCDDALMMLKNISDEREQAH